MKKILKKLFYRKPKAILLEGNVRVVPAFTWQGETYYMHEDPLNISTGRGLTAMVVYEELLMRCDVNYLNHHIAEMDKIFSDAKKTNLPRLYQLHANMKERVKFLTALPEHVFKLAAIVFFTKDESYFKCDSAVNKKKVEAWQAAPDMYDFFLRTPLKTLLPFLELPQSNTKEYLEAQELISKRHLTFFQDEAFSSISS